MWFEGETTVVFDVPPGPTLLQALRGRGVTEIEHVFISHGDKDHAGGLETLIRDFDVKHLHVHTEAGRSSEFWRDLWYTYGEMRREGKPVPDMPSTRTGDAIRTNETVFQVLSPPPEVEMLNVGARYDDAPITKHSMCIVVRILHRGEAVALIPGDLDQHGFAILEKEHVDLRARLLLAPHHGGRSGAPDDAAFFQSLTNRVSPEVVIVSNGRDRYDTPRAEVVSGIRSAGQARLVCTQLSGNCAEVLPDALPGHLAALPAAGRHTRSCCAGSLKFALDGTQVQPSREKHEAFIAAHAPRALCRGRAVPIQGPPSAAPPPEPPVA